jgi:hypothetical protein
MKRIRTYSKVLLAAAAALLLAGLLPASIHPAYAATGLSLSRSAVAAGDKFEAKGSGFTPRDNVDVFADFNVDGTAKRTQIATSITLDGTFTATLTVPPGTAPSTYQVTARDFHSHTATQYLNVLPLAQLTAGGQPGKATILAGHYFFVRGSGFKAGEKIQISASFPLYNGNTVNVSKSATADANGAFGEIAIQVPQGAKADTVNLAAKGQASGKIATSNITAVYRPAVALNPSILRPGGTVVATGSGFVPGTTVHVSVTIPRQNASTVTLSKDVTAGDHGAFTVSLTLPTKTSPGVYAVAAHDAVGNFNASTKLTATLKPVIAVLPNSILPGQSVAVNGSGFAANTTVTLTVVIPLYGGGNHTASQNVQTDSVGNFSTHLSIPGQAAAGAVTIVATGPNGQSKAAISIQHIAARIAVSPTPIRPGSNITVTGSGYPAGDHVSISVAVKLSNGSSKVLTIAATADSHGKFTTSLSIPGDVAAGAYTAVAKSETTGRAPSTRLLVAVAGKIALQPAAVSPGGTTTVSGHGFSGGVSVTVSASVAMYGGGSKTVSATARTDASGAFAAKLGIPGNAAAGTLTVIAKGPNTATSAHLQIGRVLATVTLSASSIIPGTAITVHGAGYPAGDTVGISVSVRGANGATRALTTSTRATGNGSFTVTLKVPADVVGGTYTIVARSASTGRAPHAQFSVVKLAPSLVAAPTTASPGTQIVTSGFGFAAGEAVTILLNGKSVGTATAGSSGKFAVKIGLSANLATGPYSLTATGNAGHKAAATLTITRTISSHFYFASIFTGPGHEEDLAFVNPSSIRAQVKITYQRSNGTTTVKTITVNPTSRFTESANTDLGSKVSAAASIAADVPIGAALIKYQGHEASVIPGSRRPSTIWYFANGNTSGQYREYLALQNPNNGPVQVAIHLFPTHHAPMTLYRTLPATSRLTVKVNTFVRDAVGVTITSNGPIVANRTIKIRHGIDSKNGVSAPQRTWYFAAGPRAQQSRHWIGIVNPSSRSSYVTVRAYGELGRNLGTAQGWLKAGARVGYLINRIAHQPDAAVVITASRPIVAEQTTYIGGNHDASTDTFGVQSPAKSWAYAAVTTSNARGAQDFLDLFNPNLTALPVAVEFMTTSGATTQRTYVVGPLSHQRIDVGSVEPNAQLGVLATSNQPFVGLNRTFYQHGRGGSTSQGVQP